MDVRDAAAEYRIEPVPVADADNVPPGYKRTEVGVIPNDWQVRALREISSPVRGGSPRPAGDPRFFNGAFIPWLTVAELTNIPASQLVVRRTASLLTEEGSIRSRTLKPGTVIIANSGATLGVAKLLGIKCCANDGIAALLTLDRNVSPGFVVYVVNSKTTYLREVVATGNGQPNLNTDLIGAFKAALPGSRAEQEAIAEVLADADALIESLQQLIAKQRAIKHGAMQALLTGRQRLPGFSREWQSRTLADFGDVYGGLTGKAKRDFGHGAGRYVTFMNVMANVIVDSGALERIDVVPGESQNNVARGDLFFNGSSETPEEVGMCSVLSEPLYGTYLNSFCFGYRAVPEAPVAPLYLAYFFRSDAGRVLLAPLAQGAIRYNLSKRALLELEFKLPSREEQTAIAAVLSDMDAAIDALEARLAKTRALKAGMLQQLLTGRIRLPLDHAA